MRYIYCLLLLLPLAGRAQRTWTMTGDGGIHQAAASKPPHTDHLEMSGKQLSAIVHYGFNEAGKPVFSRKLVFPMLRSLPNNTRANLIREFKGSALDAVLIDGKPVTESVQGFYIHGKLVCESKIGTDVVVTRRLFPSPGKAAFVEAYHLENRGKQNLVLDIPETDSSSLTDAAKGVYGAYVVQAKTWNGGRKALAPGRFVDFHVVYSARKQADPPLYIDPAFEESQRMALVKELEGKLVLHTPNDTINRMFAFAKLRAAESIYETKAGLMHGPGGGEYYAAIWANDQAEYVNPFFGYLGYDAGLASARNSFRIFAQYINPEYKPIPSSIIAEGDSYWNGAGDRGDQAMIGYGAAKYALTVSNPQDMTALWPLVKWCNEYMLRKKSADGVYFSDSDELEGRFKAGKYNLSTNVLTYASLLYGARMADWTGDKQVAAEWKSEAEKLKTNIEKYFGANVEGFNTYRYFDGNDKLRAWICLPLVVGINDRKDETLAALLSPKLWSPDGLLTESGSKTFWDRSTLYAFRGIFKAGATDTALKYLAYYSSKRLLGEHVPYAIEAWPEGNQRHLSAESGLYCRAIVEGMFGFDPVGYKAFAVCPKLPSKWGQMALQNVHAFGTVIDLSVQRKGRNYKIIVKEKGKPEQSRAWDGKQPVYFNL
ncbi:glucosidase family protein [Chitinophaga rhizosphaerae]|uniref:hypothetical protein n=1 Tax=Chitinophaga rhizosphaerae TaxID=1864947 RepID=UPI000F80FD06|nr:hypothetical protein [Chitinophaga rhizosphaerae]